MSKPVRTTPRADAQITTIDAWWREHRDGAPDLFEQELALGLRVIGSAPGAGRRYPHPGAVVRRYLLRSTRNHVYYVERPDHVLVLAAWGGPRGGSKPHGHRSLGGWAGLTTPLIHREHAAHRAEADPLPRVRG